MAQIQIPVPEIRMAQVPVPGPDPELVARLRASGSVWAEDEAELLVAEFPAPSDLESAARRRIAGEPFETVLGWAMFHGIRIGVAPGVFVPRPRTGFLVDVALGLLSGADRPVVADLCCGSGALGAAVLAERPDAVLVAGDLDGTAVAVARRNLPGVRVEVGDLTAAVPERLRGRLDLVLANVPYVPTAEIDLMPREAREHEPRATLDGGPDGLDVYRRLVGEVGSWLRPGGAVLSEIAARQVTAARDAANAAGLVAWTATSPDGDTTVLGATRTPPER